MSDLSRFHTLKEACGIERLAPERLGCSLTCARPTDNGPSKLAHLFFQEVAWLILYCARRTRPFRGRAFREQEDDQATSPSCFRVPTKGCRGRLGSESAHASLSFNW